jgi:hypothetical protein
MWAVADVKAVTILSLWAHLEVIFDNCSNWGEAWLVLEEK